MKQMFPTFSTRRAHTHVYGFALSHETPRCVVSRALNCFSGIVLRCNAFTEKPFRANLILETAQTVLRNHLRDVASREATVGDPGAPRARIAAGACDIACAADNFGAIT